MPARIANLLAVAVTLIGFVGCEKPEPEPEPEPKPYHRTLSRLSEISESQNAIVIRTDFSSASGWKSVHSAITNPAIDASDAYVDFLETKELEGLSLSKIATAIDSLYDYDFVFVCDKLTMTSPEQLVLVLNLHDAEYRSFRTPPKLLYVIENNLSIANMDWEEFAESLNPAGVFAEL